MFSSYFSFYNKGFRKSLARTACGKTVEKSVTGSGYAFTSRSDSAFERSNISLKENKRDGVDPNSNGLEYCIRKNEGKILSFSAY